MKLYVAIPENKMLDFPGVIGASLNLANDFTFFRADKYYARMEFLSDNLKVVGYSDDIVRKAFSLLLSRLAVLVDNNSPWQNAGVVFDKGEYQGQIVIHNKTAFHIDDTFVILEYLEEEEILQLYEAVSSQFDAEDDFNRRAFLN